MKFRHKEFIIGIILGGIIFGSISIFANEVFNVSVNPFKITVNGNEKAIEGYNINGYSYFKLRDIGEQVGFSVDFNDNTIVIETNDNDLLNNSEESIVMDKNNEVSNSYNNCYWIDENTYIKHGVNYYRWSYYVSSGLLSNSYLNVVDEMIDNEYNIVLSKRTTDEILLENIEYILIDDILLISEDYFNEYILPLDK